MLRGRARMNLTISRLTGAAALCLAVACMPPPLPPDPDGGLTPDPDGGLQAAPDAGAGDSGMMPIVMPPPDGGPIRLRYETELYEVSGRLTKNGADTVCPS